MNATLEDVTRKKREPTAEEMMRRARDQGLSLTGPDRMLGQLTKTVLEGGAGPTCVWAMACKLAVANALADK